MKAVIIGATGATGKDLLQELLQSENTDAVLSLGRKPIDIQHPKLNHCIINFDQYDQWKNLVKGDIAFSCLGTTLKAAGSKKLQKKIDFDYQLNFAKAARENGTEHFILISSYGANSHSKLFYSKMKGELEEEIIRLKFPQLRIFQPGLLFRKNSDRLGERWSVSILNGITKFTFFKKYKPLPTSILAKAMLKISQNKEKGLRFIRLQEIWTESEENNN